MFNKIFTLTAFLAFLISCSASDTPVGFSISSPREGWTYTDDMQVILAVNADVENVSWASSVDGDIGSGNNILKWLSPGTHIITAHIDGYKKQVKVTVCRKILSEYDEIKVLLNDTSLVKRFSSGIYYPSLVTGNGTTENIYLSIAGDKTRSKNINSDHKDVSGTGINCIRDIGLNMRRKILTVDAAVKQKKSVSTTFSLGDKRNFRVIDTVTQENVPHIVTAELYYSSAGINIWVSDDAVVDIGIMRSCIESIESVVLPRVCAIWGSQADIDSDGKIAILLSNTINEEKTALGFYNSSDFFEYCDDINSDSYNPCSNEMDIIYAAIPDNTPGSSYSTGAIVATIGHELTHAANFTNKTWNRLKAGEKDAQLEETFLDEGLSHLSENLLGCGVSGGNILFFNLYLNDSASYSFCRPDIAGRSDSAGIRGAMTMFMSWLFWKKGGMRWDSNNPTIVTDAGGIEFLHRLVLSPATGWDSIGLAFGKPTSQLFQEMIYEINRCRIGSSQYVYITDKLTGEPVEFFSNMGDIKVQGNIINIGHPKVYQSDFAEKLSTLPWSVIFLKNFSCTDYENVHLNADKISGEVYLNSVYTTSN